MILLLLLSPLAGFVINVFFGKQFGKNAAGWLGTAAVFVSFIVTLTFFVQVIETGKPIVVVVAHVCDRNRLANSRLFDFIHARRRKATHVLRLP